MKENSESLRQALKAIKRPRPNTAYPRGLRAKAATYIAKHRAAGEVAKALGISINTATRWHDKSHPTSSSSARELFLPVQMKQREMADSIKGQREHLTLVVPGGYHLEGLDVADAARLLRALR
jgi:hypothetical protein